MSFLTLYSGGRFDYDKFGAYDITLLDVAHALARIGRFNGHGSEFYSVAQHSVSVALFSPPHFARWGLLHDATEAYVNDLPRPLKYREDMVPYRLLEKRVSRAIAERFNLSPLDEPEEVREADREVTNAEALILGLFRAEWGEKPHIRVSKPLTPENAERRFVEMAREVGLL